MDNELFTQAIRDIAVQFYNAIRKDAAEIYIFVPTHDIAALIDIDRDKKLLQFIVRLDSDESKCQEYAAERYAKELL